MHGNCLRCGRHGVHTIQILVDGRLLEGRLREINRQCVTCTANHGQEMTYTEYNLLIRNRDIRQTINWDSDHSGQYVMLRYGATASYMAFRDTMSSKWRLAYCSEVSEGKTTYIFFGPEFAHLHECKEAAIEDLQERYANGERV